MSKDNIDQQEMAFLEAQAKEMAGLLDAHADHLSMRTLKQLEDGRMRAIKAHGQYSAASVNSDGTISHLSAWVDHHRLTFIGLVALTVVLSYLATQTFSSNETSDAFLLSADLPPEAFVDRGFEPSLNRRENI
jgi:hypothetical protein